MSRKLMLSAVIFLFCLSPIFAGSVNLGTNVDDISVTVQESNSEKTVIRYEIGSYLQEPVQIDNLEYQVIGLIDEGIIQEKGAPSLPRISRSIIIPDEDRTEIKILESEYVEFTNVQVAPSKGNLTRQVNPADIPYKFGDTYSVDAFYPSETATLRDPYILRDYRGQVIDINAVQYNPVTKTLRIYTAIVVEVYSAGAGQVNTIPYRKNNSVLIEEFDKTYNRHFINYAYQTDKYTHLVDRGDMLIITYDSYHDAMLPLVNWKIQKGIKTTILDISAVGNNTTSIKNTIQSYYDDPDYNLAWVLLVGDHAQITSLSSGGGASDPSFVLLAGSDSYPDAFIGRFSAESVAHVETQVERTVAYESNPQGSDWFHKATGIASDEGSGVGHNGEADYTHMGYIRDDLLSYDYDVVDELYDPGASSSQVTSALNSGRGFINYVGHGSNTAWSTTGFSNTGVNALTNADKLPFIISVACVNGNFASTTCFGEAWLRATHNGSPTGAVGAYMSSINQDWVPPMHAQDESTDLLIAEVVTTFGGLCFNGSMKMIDLSGSSGIEMYETWHIFGDPSLQLWTDNPATMTVNHDDVFLIGLTEVSVEVSGVENALCAVTYNNEILGRGYTDATGTATIAFEGELPVGASVTLTVTAFNFLPYTTGITVITPDGPYLVYDLNDIDDFAGNNNGMVDYGETVGLGVQLKNVGPDAALAVGATLATGDSYVTITDGTESFGDIAGDNGTGYVSGAFEFSVAANVPDGHIISFDLTMTDGNDSTWVSSFSVTAHAPVLNFQAVTIDDASGNNNGVFDPGESVNISVAIGNTGSGEANGVTATLTESDTYISILDGAGSFDDIVSAGSAENTMDMFSADADGGCPRGHEVTFTIDVSAVNGFTTQLQFTTIIGDRVVFHSDDFSFNQGWTGLGGNAEWTIGVATGGSGADSYGSADPAIDHSPTGDNGVMGNDLTAGSGGDYTGGLSTTYWATSPVIDCGDFNGCTLEFWRWLGVEQNSYDHAYFEVYNGTSWVQLFANGSSTIDESSWTEQSYDVSAYADSNSNFMIRFGFGGTDGSMNWCGWNIDDLSIKGYGERSSADIAFDVENMTDSLVPGDNNSQTLWVFNESPESILRVTFSTDVGWLAFDTDQQYVDPLDSLPFLVTFESAGMDAGDYNGLLTFSCNDYTNQFDTIEVSMHLFAPVLDVATDPLTASCGAGETTTCQFTINNAGAGRLNYSIGCQMFDGKSRLASVTATGVTADPIGFHPLEDKGGDTEPFFGEVVRSAGGPDAFGYSWIDSDDASGPTYGWIDISAIGVPIVMTDDDSYGPVGIGFGFPFYDSTYADVYIGSNGVLSFGAGTTARTNQDIPSVTTPNNVIAMWWDDLDVAESGNVYYYYDNTNNRFIISFDNVPNYKSPDGTGSLSFQAILYPNGQILLQYGTMDHGEDASGHTSATIGLENVDGSDGLGVVYNADYMHDNLAISFKAARWMSVMPAGGSIEPFESQIITVNFDADELSNGEFGGQLTLVSNDPDLSTVTIPVSLSVASYVCGDVNGSGDVNVADAVYLINFVFKSGPAPDPMQAADANNDTQVNIADAVFLINFIFNGGAPPACTN